MDWRQERIKQIKTILGMAETKWKYLSNNVVVGYNPVTKNVYSYGSVCGGDQTFLTPELREWTELLDLALEKKINAYVDGEDVL